MSLRDGVGDERLDTAEAFRELNQPHLVQNRFRLLLRRHVERDHGAEPARLLFLDGETGMLGKAGVNHLRHGRLRLEPPDDFRGILLRFFHADCERLDSAERQPRVERGKARARRLYEEAEFFLNVRAVRHDEARERVVVPREEFRPRVDDDIGAEGKRVLEIRRHERVVHDKEKPVLFRDARDSRDVGDVHHGVCRRLDVYCLRRRRDERRKPRLVKRGDVLPREGDAVFSGNVVEKAD